MPPAELFEVVPVAGTLSQRRAMQGSRYGRGPVEGDGAAMAAIEGRPVFVYSKNPPEIAAREARIA